MTNRNRHVFAAALDPATLRQRVKDRLPRAGTWYSIHNAAGPQATIRIYSEIGWFGVTAEDFARDLADITADHIEVQINSVGGDVFDGVAIFNALRSHTARVTTRVDGMAASIASVIVQAGDQRVMLTGSQMMIHEAWGLSIGSAQDMRDFAEILDKQSDLIAGIYAERTGKDVAHFRELMTGETWFTADEAVTAGLADQTVAPARQEQNATLQEQIKGVLDSAERVAALRAEKGKHLSQVNRDSLDELRARLEALLTDEAAPGPESTLADEIRREHMKLLATA